MFKPLAALTLSASLALTSLAPTPAQAADAEDIASILFGAAVLGMIAAAAQADDDRTRTTSRRATRVTRPQASVPAPRWEEPVIRREAARRRNVLPAQCQRSFDLKNGTRTFLMKKCLKRNGIRTASLPNRCQRQIDLPGKAERTGWQRACLKKKGYAIR